MRSLSLSVSGQPSSSSNPSLSSGTIGHRSSLSRMPSLSLSGSGQPSSSSNRSKSWIVGALVDVVLEAVAVAVADVRLEDDADHAAQVRVRALAGQEAPPRAEREERVARE